MRGLLSEPGACGAKTEIAGKDCPSLYVWSPEIFCSMRVNDSLLISNLR
jgi:hypothetical protein